MTITELVQLVLTLLTCAVLIATLARFLGGRWRSVAEAAKVDLAARDATLIEKDLALEEKDKTIAGMSERLARLDEERKEFGGSRVYEMLTATQQEMVAAFRELTNEARAHEKRAAERSEAMVALIRSVGQDIVRCMDKDGRQ